MPYLVSRLLFTGHLQLQWFQELVNTMVGYTMDGRGEPQPSRSALISKIDDNIAFGKLKDRQTEQYDRQKTEH